MRSVKLFQVLGWVLLCGTAVGNDVVYRNDFTTRTSQEPIPALGVWHEASPYLTKNGMLCCRPTTHADDGSFSTYEQLSTRFPYYWKPASVWCRGRRR